MDIEFYKRLPELIDPMKSLGATYARSGAIAATRTETGEFVAAFCMQQGITIGQFLATYDLIQGVPRKKALACLAEFKAKGGKVKWTTESNDLVKASAKFTTDTESQEVTFTIQDAERQGLVRPNSNWTRRPEYMLRARVITTAIGMLDPSIVAGSADFSEDSEPVPTAPLNLETAKKPETTVAPIPTTNIDKPKTTGKITIEPKEKFLPPSVEPAADDEVPMDFPTKKTEEPLSLETLKAISDILAGHYAEAANWMIKEGWLTATTDQKLKTEVQAANYLRQALPLLSKARAKHILKEKMDFMVKF